MMDYDANLKISLVIPVYHVANQVEETASKLTKLLTRMRNQHQIEVIFVDDGSRDNTVERLQTAFADDAQVQVVSHAAPRGTGQTLSTGFSRATGDIIITTDFDQHYNLNTIPQILAHLLVYEVDVVTASPLHPNGQVIGRPFYQRLFVPGISFLYRLLVKWDVHTWTAQFRAYRREVLDNVSFSSDDVHANTELIVNAIRAGYTVSEYPIQQHFKDANRGGLRATKDHLTYQLKLLFSNRKQQPEQNRFARHRT